MKQTYTTIFVDEYAEIEKLPTREYPKQVVQDILEDSGFEKEDIDINWDEPTNEDIAKLCDFLNDDITYSVWMNDEKIA